MKPIRDGWLAQEVLDDIRNTPEGEEFVLSARDAACIIGMVDEWDQRLHMLNKYLDKLNKVHRYGGR